MSEVCKLLEPSLIRYAEGELHETKARRRLRRHLDGCAHCRAILREHDALTSRILSGSTRLVGQSGAWLLKDESGLSDALFQSSEHRALDRQDPGTHWQAAPCPDPRKQCQW